MNAVPAQIAGVGRIAVTTPYARFQANPVVAAALAELGLEEVYGVGGAQAIAALAYGTETVPSVDKIVGPGNAYVSAAKRQVFGQVDIDKIAGPSEVVVVADDSAHPDYVAADLMAQAEHDEAAVALAIVYSRVQAEAIRASLDRQISELSRQATIRTALENYGAVLVVSEPGEAVGIVNRIAPEHLELLTRDAESTGSAGGGLRGHLLRYRFLRSGGRLLCGPQPCSADRRQRPFRLAPGRLRFREADQPGQVHSRGSTQASSVHRAIRPGREARCPRPQRAKLE